MRDRSGTLPARAPAAALPARSLTPHTPKERNYGHPRTCERGLNPYGGWPTGASAHTHTCTGVTIDTGGGGLWISPFASSCKQAIGYNPCCQRVCT